MRTLFLTLYMLVYQSIARPIIFRLTPQHAHALTIRFLRWLDDQHWAEIGLRWLNAFAFQQQPVIVGGVPLPHPMILAAGFVKGDGFSCEAEALSCIDHNIIPGWRSVPLLLGAVEFGSFTRAPRLGNPGVVLWRDQPTRSTQNRVGLKNPGALAAAAFLGQHRHQLPTVFGINIAVSPGVTSEDQECHEIRESIAAFLDQDIRPAWFTLNLSCPNTDDDPDSHQTETRARELCTAVMQLLKEHHIPLWVKISPDLSTEQYHTLLRTFSETGVRAVIATNTLGNPAPDGTTAGVGGGQLHAYALSVVETLAQEKQSHAYALDIIASGGVNDGITYQRYTRHGVRAMQYWSALIYRGPLAAALIEQEGIK